MKKQTLKIESNRMVVDKVWEMKLSGCDDVQKPGQFVNIALEGKFLRRPISVNDWKDGVLTLLYKVVGRGTAQMADMKAGECLDVLTGLGNGFDFGVDCTKPVLIGGGIGVAPLYLLAKELLAKGVKPSVILGFNTASEVILKDEFEALGLRTLVTTVDGSCGIKGFVTNALPELGYDYFYTCGPMPMLRALAPAVTSKGQLSLEERMGCGTGICMGCTCKTLLGAKRVCKDGPVFTLDEIAL